MTAETVLKASSLLHRPGAAFPTFGRERHCCANADSLSIVTLA